MNSSLTLKDNPLLSQSELPNFSLVTADHVIPAISYLIEMNEVALDKLLAQNTFQFNTLVLPLETMEEKLNQVWNVVSHLDAVRNAPDFHEAYENALLKLTEYYTKLYQNEALYQAYGQVSKITPHRIIDNTLQDFRLSGILLNAEKKEQFKKLNIEISELESRFEQNVLLATEKWTFLIKEEERSRLKGIPDADVDAAKQYAASKQKTGYLFSLQYPSYHAVMTYADDRDLRKIFYEAYVTRASELNKDPKTHESDNGPLMLEILNLREQMAALLNYHNYAEYALERRLAKTPDEVLDFIEDLCRYAKPKASAEIGELKKFASSLALENTIEPWDIAYYSEKLIQQKFNISEEMLKSYFPLDKVLTGLFNIVQILFEVRIKEVKDFDKWHETVRLFEVYDSENSLCGKFYLDLFARDNKQEGAWVSDYKRRMVYGDVKQMPIAFLTTNFSSNIDPKKTCLTHDELITLFHEFGHCLHQVLTKVDYPSISGTSNVELDAIEFPSQFLENWCWEKEALQQLSAHLNTGECLPIALVDQLWASKNFQFGMQMLRQLEFALFDFKVHLQRNIENVRQIQSILDDVRKQVALLPMPKFNRFQNTFSHIFGGSYAAGYYSYTWAEMMACDAFQKFQEEGILNPKIGKQFLSTILSKGGLASARDLFLSFRGRQPNISAFLKYYDLIGRT